MLKNIYLTTFLLFLVSCNLQQFDDPATKIEKDKNSTQPAIDNVPTSVSGFSEKELLIRELPPWIVAQGLENNQDIQNGLLPVELYNGWNGNTVDKTGVVISTIAIQKAIDDARDYHMVAYFKFGTYLIDDTLKGMMKVTQKVLPNGSTKYLNARRKSVVIHGQYSLDTPNKRPIIKLKANAIGFGSISSPKAALHLWSQCTGNEPGCAVPASLNSTDEQANVAFNQVVKNLEINLSGNIGAVGIHNNSAQGSSIENINILATNSYAGLYEIPSRGWGVSDLTVTGGLYGIFDTKSVGAIIVNATLTNQTKAAIHAYGSTPLTVVGFKIKSNTVDPYVAVETSPWIGGFSKGAISMVDGFFDMPLTLSNVIKNTGSKTVLLKNIYLKGSGKLILNGITTKIIANNSYIEKYFYENPNFNLIPSLLQVDSQIVTDFISSNTSTIIAPDYQSKHSVINYDYNSLGAINVKAYPFNAFGDGLHDDTKVLQTAIDNTDIVFLPKGTYRISAPLKLKANTRLIGVSKNFTEIFVDTKYWCPTSKTSLFTTEEAPYGDTYLSEIMITVPTNDFNCEHFGAIKWQVGSRSVVKNLIVENSLTSPRNETNERDLFEITGSGGGKWFSLTNGATRSTLNNNYHFLNIHDTNSPLVFYGFNPEHNQASPYITINNSRNISIYSTKVELTHVTTGVDPNFDLLHANNSEQISIIGYSAAGAHNVGKSLFKFINTTKFELGNTLPSPSHNGVTSQGNSLITSNGVTESIPVSRADSRNHAITYFNNGEVKPQFPYDNSYTYCTTQQGMPLRLDVKLPTIGTAPYPVIMFIHGGGWRKGSRREDLTNLLNESTSRGYAAVSVDYRLSTSKQIDTTYTANNIYAVGAPFPAQIYDIKCAIKWIKKNASKVKIDPNKIGLVGSSSGGHLAMLAAITSRYDNFGNYNLKPRDYDLLNEDTSVKAVVNWFGPTDMLYTYNNSLSLVAAQKMISSLFNGKGGFLPASYQFDQSSSKNYVVSNKINIQNLNVLTLHGNQDEVIPFAQVEAMNDLLNTNGVKSMCKLMDKVKHGFAPGTGNALTGASIKTKAFDDAYLFFNDTLKGSNTFIATPPGGCPVDINYGI